MAMAINIETDGLSLLNAIANKQQDPISAEKCFLLFVSSFEADLLKFTEIHAQKLGFPIDSAFEAVQCAFAKVWNYPSFDPVKSRCKDIRRGILVWLKRIATSQLYDYVKKNVCAQQTHEDDLSVIEDAASFVDICIGDRDPEEKLAYVQALENRISCLGEKHRIIYLTYKAYDSVGKKPSRKLLKTLRNRLHLTQETVRVYKMEAERKIKDHME